MDFVAVIEHSDGTVVAQHVGANGALLERTALDGRSIAKVHGLAGGYVLFGSTPGHARSMQRLDRTGKPSGPPVDVLPNENGIRWGGDTAASGSDFLVAGGSSTATFLIGLANDGTPLTPPTPLQNHNSPLIAWDGMSYVTATVGGNLEDGLETRVQRVRVESGALVFGEPVTFTFPIDFDHLYPVWLAGTSGRTAFFYARATWPLFEPTYPRAFVRLFRPGRGRAVRH